jgi:hypothetical protein
MRLKATCLLLFFFLAATTVHAQRLTGTIRGQILDNSKAPIPGVNVTLEGEALIGGPQTAQSNETGNYRFPGLPPGSYRLTFALEGFQTVVHDQVRVVLGTTLDENVEMNLSKVSEQLVITGETPLVDSTKPGYSTNYTQEYLKDTPIARFTFFDFVQMAPGSSPMRFDNTSFSHSILGSNTNENMYQMDGTDLTSALTGAAWPWPNTDIIEEIELLDLGAPAEYGNYQGAVVNVVTKSGGNSYHGDANFYLQTQGLTGSNVSIDPDGEGPSGPVPFHRDEYRDFTFQLGGPILKDKLWFFGGVQARREHFSEPGTPPEFPKKEDDDRYFLKVTYDVSKANKLQLSLHNDYYNIPGEISLTHPFDTSIVEKGSNPTPNVMWTSVLNDKSILEVRYAGFYGHDIGAPQNGKYVSGHYDLYTGYYSGGIISWYDGDIWKSQVSGKLSYYADNFIKGSHDFRFGAQYTGAGNDYIYAITNGVLYYDYDNAPYVAYFQLPYHIGADVKSIGTYVDDTWTLANNLTLSLGVRFDHSTGSIPDFPQLDIAGSETGTTVNGLGKVADWNVISPRLGFTYRFPSKKAMQIRGHYGRYYQALLTPYLQRAGPARSPIEGRAFNPDTGQFDDVFFRLDPSSQIQIDKNLKDPYTDQFAIGFDREITSDIAFGASYIYKRSRDFIGTENIGAVYETVPFIDPLTGKVIDVFNQINDPTADNLFFITNPDFFHEEYHGLLLSLTKRMTKDWTMSASLTISRARGFHAGSGLGPGADQDSSFFPADNAKFGQDQNDFINADGLLNGDRTYIFKLQGSYRMPWDVLLSVNDTQMTGRPFARQILVPDLNQGPRIVFAEERDGSRRTSAISILDLRVEKTFVISGSWNVAVSADIFNLFNSDAFYDVATTLFSPETQDIFGQGSVFVPPRRVMVGAKLRF